MFICDENLSGQFRSTVNEIKSLCGQALMSDSILDMDPDQVAIGVRSVKAMNDLLDVTCDMFEKQERLMEKMSKALDKYLED